MITGIDTLDKLQFMLIIIIALFDDMSKKIEFNAIDSHLLNQNTPRAIESVIIAGYFLNIFQVAIYLAAYANNF